MTDLIVIGAGPAGMTSALYALRNGKSVTIIEKNSVGGQIAESPRVENFPSQVSISGPDLADKMFAQIDKLGVDFQFGQVTKLEKKKGVFYVTLDDDQIFESRAVIIAAGVQHRKLGLENEERLIGHGVSYCALCDGAFFKDEDVAVVGDGNSALQFALLLSSFCNKVSLVTMFDRFFGDESLVSAVKAKKNVKIIHNYKLSAMNGDESLDELVFDGAKPLKLKAKALFVAIGQVPQNDVFAKLVELEKGFIVCDEEMATKTKGLFAAGDCRVKTVRQVATACGDGAIAATSACTYLEKLK